jgi:hypothetical protein
MADMVAAQRVPPGRAWQPVGNPGMKAGQSWLADSDR